MPDRRGSLSGAKARTPGNPRVRPGPDTNDRTQPTVTEPVSETAAIDIIEMAAEIRGATRIALSDQAILDVERMAWAQGVGFERTMGITP
jgi:hypothetical protein